MAERSWIKPCKESTNQLGKMVLLSQLRWRFNVRFDLTMWDSLMTSTSKLAAKACFESCVQDQSRGGRLETCKFRWLSKRSKAMGKQRGRGGIESSQGHFLPPLLFFFWEITLGLYSWGKYNRGETVIQERKAMVEQCPWGGEELRSKGEVGLSPEWQSFHP